MTRHQIKMNVAMVWVSEDNLKAIDFIGPVGGEQLSDIIPFGGTGGVRLRFYAAEGGGPVERSFPIGEKRAGLVRSPMLWSFFDADPEVEVFEDMEIVRVSEASSRKDFRGFAVEAAMFEMWLVKR